MENDLICISPKGATHRLLLLHGWGADADDLIPLGQDLIKRIPKRDIELVSLRAPQNHPEGYGRQWYGLFPPNWSEVPLAISDLKTRIKLICKEQISFEKTVVLGFSQGGAMALAVGTEMPLAGLIGCSAYPHPNWMPPNQSPAVLLLHGVQDEVVPIQAAKALAASLQRNQVDVETCFFEGGHEIQPKTMEIIQRSLLKWFV